MTFFYDLNAKLNNIGKEAAKLEETKQVAKKTPVREALETTLAQDFKKLWEDGTGGANFSGSGSLEEKWGGDTKLNPAKKGMFAGKTKADLEKQLANLHKSGPHKKGTPEYTKQQELNFAIRAKSGWKKDVEESFDVTDDSEELDFELPKKLGKIKTNPIKLQALRDRQAEKDAEREFDYDFDFDSKPKHPAASVRPVTFNHADDAAMDELDEAIPMTLESSMKHQMMADAERMSLQQFCEKYGNEAWVKEFWENAGGQMDEDQQMMEYLKRKAQRENAHMVAVNGKNPAHAGIEFEEDGPHGKPQWLIDAQKRAEKRQGKDVEECEMYESAKPVYVRKSKLAEDDDMTKNQIHTIRRAARALESIVRADEEVPEWVKSKITIANDYLKTVRDYLESAMERSVERMTGREGVTSELDEKITKKSTAGEIISDFEKSKNPKFAGKSKAERKTQALGAYYGMHPEKSTKEDVKKDDKAERAGKRVAKDIEYDEKVKDAIHGKKRDSEDDKAERAGKHVAKDIEYDDKKKAKKVKETITAGSVAPTAVKSGKSSATVGKGIYDSINRQVEDMISESFDIDMSKRFTDEGEEASHITINASGAEADMLKDLLKNAGIDVHRTDMSQDYEQEEICSDCGHRLCQCDEGTLGTLGGAALGAALGGPLGAAVGAVGGDELTNEADVTVSMNEPDWPTNNEFSDDSLQYSGGLNKPKRTVAGDGQTTVPVTAVQVSEERSLFDLYKAIADRT